MKNRPGRWLSLDIIAQLAADIPVDLSCWPVLVEVVVAEPGIDGEMHLVVAVALLIALAELEKLETFLRLGPLAAAIVRHVAREHDAARRRDPFAGGAQPGRARRRFPPAMPLPRCG